MGCVAVHEVFKLPEIGFATFVSEIAPFRAAIVMVEYGKVMRADQPFVDNADYETVNERSELFDQITDQCRMLRFIGMQETDVWMQPMKPGH